MCGLLLAHHAGDQIQRPRRTLLEIRQRLRNGKSARLIVTAVEPQLAVLAHNVAQETGAEALHSRRPAHVGQSVFDRPIIETQVLERQPCGDGSPRVDDLMRSDERRQGQV